MQKKFLVYGLAVPMAIAIACGGDSKAPVSPSDTIQATADAAADGSTLKATPPTPYAPADGIRLETRKPELVITDAAGKFVAATFSYRFQLIGPTGADVENVVEKGGSGTGGVGRTVHQVTKELTTDTAYRWRARAETDAGVGPWSAYRSFLTPISPGSLPSYQTTNELWDNLSDGKTIGRAVNMDFVPGKGARTIGNQSYIRYALQSTLSVGEFSFYVDNLNPLSAGDKTKVMSMMEGDSDITTNDYRFTVEKRGVTYPSPGQVRIRIITGEPTEGRIFDSIPEVPDWVKGKTYFVKLTWGNGRVRFVATEAEPVTGKLIAAPTADIDFGYDFTYKPVPHIAFIGAPTGRGGPQDASVSNMTARWVFIGGPGTKRPGTFAGSGFEVGLQAPGSDGPGF